MIQSRFALSTIALSVFLLLPTAAAAQSSYLYGVGVYYGLGGSSDANPDAGFGNGTYQLGFNLNTDPNGRVFVRAGHLDLDDNGQFGDLLEAGLDYANVGGEYRFRTAYYDSGVYLGLGGYRLEGVDLETGKSADDTNLGFVLGLTGEFAINRRWSVLVELSGHWVDFDTAQVFAMGHVGLGFYF